MTPKLSIITINFNNLPGLKKTMQSVFEQDYRDLEYIIIDGGSTDGCAAFIKENSELLAFWVSEKDDGIYHAMNKGIRQTKGEYLLFLNSGDYLLAPDTCNRMLRDASADLVYGNLARIFPDGNTDVVKMPRKLTAKFIINEVLCHPVTFIKHSLFEDLGFYNESLKIVSDWLFFLQALLGRNTTWEYRDIEVAMFDMSGLSSMDASIPVIVKEREDTKARWVSKTITDLISENENQAYRLENYERIHKSHKQLLKLLIPEPLKVLIRKFRWTINRYTLKQMLFPKCIPIVINSFNRLSCLQQLIGRLEQMGYNNIHILDNASTYPPLVEYFSSIKYKVIRLPKNFGHLALWKSGYYKQFERQFFFYTDPDVLPIETCPANFARHFLNVMLKYPLFWKVGFALKIDDLPEEYPYKDKVLRWESQFWLEVKDKNVYVADIDTTFAMYRPGWFKKKFEQKFFEALRVNGPYIARHIPWYQALTDVSSEDAFYKNSASLSASWTNQLNTLY